MSEHSAEVRWSRNSDPFTDGRYSRVHTWQFDGGAEVRASASPHVVPPPLADPAAVDPEEAFVAALSSCHMLWFLFLASRRGYVVESYLDEAVGFLEKDPAGKPAMTRVTLRPRTVFVGAKVPANGELDALHHEAHERCFLANSVKTEVRCEAD